MRVMSVKRMGVLTGSVLALVLIIGAVQAGAQGSTQILKFHTGHRTQAGVGFNINSNTPQPLGAQFVLTAALYNAAPQFGKPTGARIGRVLVDCTFLALTPPDGDGVWRGRSRPERVFHVRRQRRVQQLEVRLLGRSPGASAPTRASGVSPEPGAAPPSPR